MSDRHPAYASGFWLRLVGSLFFAVFLHAGPATAVAQLGGPLPTELADNVRVDEPDPAVRNKLEQIRVNIDERQWDEAIEGLRELMENHGQRLLRLDERRFVPLREFGHMQLTGMPAEGRALYRGRVDALAKRWLNDGLQYRDIELVQRVVDELFASSFGDDALLALGEMALERGEHQNARAYWERIGPELRSADGLPLWVARRDKSSSNDKGEPPSAPNIPGASWLAYPDTDLDLADVRARLVLVSLVEGALERAKVEYASFVERHGDARGRLAGRDGLFRETLAQLLNAAEQWPVPTEATLATTFGGTPTRNFIPPGALALRGLAWAKPIPFSVTWEADSEWSRRIGLPHGYRVGEDVKRLLSYYPIVVGDLVVFHDLQAIYVFDLRTGKPAWRQNDPKMRPGQVYPRAPLNPDAGRVSHTFGVPRFTATVNGSLLFVRLGSQATGWPETRTPDKRGSLVILDLAQEGKLIAEVPPENDRWSFEGPPVCDGSRFYVAMRYNDVRPQSHVACFEIVTTSSTAGSIHKPVMRWRQMICAAESPARGGAEEISHNMLTLAEGTLYLNTNLAAVACLSAEDGSIHWVTTYPRAKQSDNSAHFFRDLNPCVYHRGTLYVAPTDSPQVFAIDAMTGMLRWATTPSALAEVVHLLGVAEGNLIASGKQLWWLDAETGKTITTFPDPLNSNQAKPFGRGLLMGDVVLWPTRQELCVFFQKQSPSIDANTKPAMPRDPIQWIDYSNHLGGGNLIAAGDYILLATPDKLWAFGPRLEENRVTSFEASVRPANE
jgi:outer membrane protein assembly factor BamB